jgi:5-methylcytosine-specific restriction endonuclease McrA
MTKTCTKCNQTKELSEFSFRNNPHRYIAQCKICVCLDQKERILRRKHLKNDKVCIDCKKKLPYTEFESSRNQCKVCRKLYNTNYYDNNKESILIQQSEYNNTHKKEKQKYDKKYRKINKHRLNKQQKYRKYKRRAIKLSIQENYTMQDELYTRTLFENVCANCGALDNLQIDHHQPLSKGNALTRENAVVLCGSCNASKKDKLPCEFYPPEKLAWIEKKLSPAPEGVGYSPTQINE